MTRCSCGMHDEIELVTGSGKVAMTYKTMRNTDELRLLYQILLPENCPECHSEDSLYVGQDQFVLCAVCDYEKHPDD